MPSVLAIWLTLALASTALIDIYARNDRSLFNHPTYLPGLKKRGNTDQPSRNQGETPNGVPRLNPVQIVGADIDTSRLPESFQRQSTGQGLSTPGRTSHDLLTEMIGHSHRQPPQQGHQVNPHQLSASPNEHNIEGPPPPYAMIRQSPHQSPTRGRPHMNGVSKQDKHPK